MSTCDNYCLLPWARLGLSLSIRVPLPSLPLLRAALGRDLLRPRESSSCRSCRLSASDGGNRHGRVPVVRCCITRESRSNGLGRSSRGGYSAACMRNAT